jgi:hypothetical protein
MRYANISVHMTGNSYFPRATIRRDVPYNGIYDDPLVVNTGMAQ